MPAPRSGRAMPRFRTCWRRRCACYAERAAECDGALPAFPSGAPMTATEVMVDGDRHAEGGEPAGVRARHVAVLVGRQKMKFMDLPLCDFRRMAVEEFDTSKLLAHAANQAAERGYKNFPIVDVDSHHYESEAIGEILDYIDDPVLQQLARSARQANAKSVGMLPSGVGYQDMGGRVMRYALRGMEQPEPGVQRDISLTRRWMDAIGVDVAVMFPTPMLQLGLHPQVEVEVALARAYNRWLCERVLAHEPRIRSMLYLPFNDAEASFRMVQEFGQSKGVVGFMVTSARYRPVHHNSYMKTYSLLEELDLPLASTPATTGTTRPSA